MEDYKKKYEDSLERAKKWYNAPNADKIPTYANRILAEIFPELRESEEEKVRKQIINHLDFLARGAKDMDNSPEYSKYTSWIAYLEKLKDFDKQLEEAYKTADEVQYKRGYGKDYVDGMADAKKKELEKQGEFPTTISVDKMVEEFERARIEANSICQIIETDAYRKGVVDTLSKILIKEEKPITIGSKKAEGKLGEMIAASKEPAESGEEDKQLTHKEVSKKSEQDKEIDTYSLLFHKDDRSYEVIKLIRSAMLYCPHMEEEDRKKVNDWLKFVQKKLS